MGNPLFIYKGAYPYIRGCSVYFERNISNTIFFYLIFYDNDNIKINMSIIFFSLVVSSLGQNIPDLPPPTKNPAIFAYNTLYKALEPIVIC